MIDENTPTSEYAPLRDLSYTYYILNPDDIDTPAVFRKVGYLDGYLWLYHETFKENEYMHIHPSDVLRKATVEEILSDTPEWHKEESL